MNQNSRENIYSLVGFGKVFRFTFQQTIKNKSFLTVAIVMILMMGLIKPLMYVMAKSNQSSAEKMMSASLENIEADKLYILNETDFVIDKEMQKVPSMGKTKEGTVKSENVVIYNKGEADEEKLLDGLTSKDILVIIRPEASGYKVNGIIADSTDVKIEL